MAMETHIDLTHQLPKATLKPMAKAPPRILVVEDSSILQYLMQTILEELPAVVTIAADGKKAIEIFEQQHGEKTNHGLFDLILMDLRMPSMDGHEATAILRKMGVQTPIIAVTAHALPGERSKCHLNGFDEYITKPIRPHKLIEFIRPFIYSKEVDDNFTVEK